MRLPNRIVFVAAVAAVLLVGLGARAEAKLRIVASIETLADLSRQVGGDRVDVTSLSRGVQDPHFVDGKPSLVLALNRADALVYVGLDLEIGWLPPLVQQARNARIQRGQPGNIDASTSIRPEDVPNVPSDQLRAMGDIHPLGNPHYWIPPKNARAIARLLADRFAALDADGAAAYRAGLARFEAQLANKEKQWESAAAPLRGSRPIPVTPRWGTRFASTTRISCPCASRSSPRSTGRVLAWRCRSRCSATCATRPRARRSRPRSCAAG